MRRGGEGTETLNSHTKPYHVIGWYSLVHGYCALVLYGLVEFGMGWYSLDLLVFSSSPYSLTSTV